MDLPAHFPAYPGPGPPHHTVQRAYQVISETYQNSMHLLYLEDADPLRLRFHLTRLQERVFPLFMALSAEGLPVDWLDAGAHVLGKLLLELGNAIKSTEEQ